ncbi:MAG: PD-(D/E)XK nuclease domain-containing protein, partial [Bacteroidales bacterium]|nr:PD-(D/E)XK nuclease domain-containing protein [Bacteroidales bacterium]
RYLMPYYTSVAKGDTGLNVQHFIRDIESGNIDAFMKRLKTLFSNTPYELVKDLENHYQNVMFIVSQLCGIYTRAEYHTSEGRIDMTMETSDYVYIWEFKFEKSAQEAIDQIEEKHYADPFRSSGKKIVCIGVNFSHAIRGIDEYLVKEVE